MSIIRVIKQLYCGLFRGHKFVLTDDNYWGYEGDAWMHQYTCKHCGRKDYLFAIDDKDKDWNHGRGDGELCPLFHQH